MKLRLIDVAPYALLLALLGGFFAYVDRGPERVAVPVAVTSQAGANCSGTLAPWAGMSHGNFGDLTTADGTPQADVVIVGDSITTIGRGALAAWLKARGHTLAGSYWSGRPTTAAVDWALSLSTKPKILVMASGTNDLFNPAVMAGQVARLKAWADTEPRTELIWVDVQAARPATALCDQRNSMWINAQIRAYLPPSQVCGWSTGFAQDPNRITRYLRPDGVHPIDGTYWAAVVGNCIY